MPYQPRVVAGVEKAQRATGLPIGRIGNLTAEDCGAAAREVDRLKLQKQFAVAMRRHVEKAGEYVKDIERIRLEAIKIGLKDEQQIQKYIYDAMKADRRFDAFMAELKLTDEQDKNLVERAHTEKKQGIIADFGRRIDRILAGIQGKEKVGIAKHQVKINALNASIADKSNVGRLTAIETERQRIKDIMSGKTGAGSQSSFSKPMNNTQPTGGFFSKVFNFLGG